jgi:hypothetical protein
MNQPYPRDEQLTAIVLGFTNKAMIADAVLPRSSPMDSPKFKWSFYAPGQFAHVPDTHVGRRTQVNEVEFQGEERHDETREYALKHVFVPRDFDGVRDPKNKKASAASALAGLLILDREVRVANLMMNEANYGNNHAQATSADMFDDESTDIVKLIRTALSTPQIRPNTMTMGQKEWDALASHPRILAAVTRAAGVNGTAGAAGIATREEVIRLFSLKDILVGEALVASGATKNATFKPAWSGGVAFTYNDMSAIAGMGGGMSNGMTFGFTAHFDKFSNTYKADHEGTRGSEVVRVVDECKEIIVAPECGFLLKGVLG